MRLFTLIAFSLASLVVAQVSVERAPTYLTSNPLPQGSPWGSRAVDATSSGPPNTGVTRPYTFTVSRQIAAPDGYNRNSLLVNGQFPGPTIEANWGDMIQVNVINNITGPEEGTAMHWHGFLQQKSQWMDGVPSVGQCPIAPGKSFTYLFQADQYGTTWYHSHYSAQYNGGILGPMVIYGPQTTPYDVEIPPITLTDYFHTDYFTLVEGVVSTVQAAGEPFSDNNLINGRNNFNCSTKAAGDETKCKSNAGIPSIEFYANETMRLRLINAGSDGIQKFSIDGHNMTVIANDFTPIKPYNTQVVTLGVGQRTDVLIKGKSNPKQSFMMRSTIAAVPCSFSNKPNATAIVYYRTQDKTVMPTTKPWPALADSVANICANDNLTLTVPFNASEPAANPPLTQVFDIGFGPNATGHWLWTMNNISFRGDYNSPILLLANLGNTSYPYSPEWNVFDFYANTSIRFIVNNPTPLAHPMHLHGHNMYILSVGTGSWDGSSVVRPSNPQRRDTQLVPANGYMVVQMTADNPGVWPFHCHIAWHVSAGLYATVIERPADIQKLQIPSTVAQTCRDWSAYTNSTVVDQIDSGL